MLPLPSSARSLKSRTYFSSLPASHSHGHPLSIPQLLATLRARTRLTNLAVSLLFLALSGSILLNLTNLLGSSPTSPAFRGRGARRKSFSISASRWDSASSEQIDSGIPLSIETTVERDGRFEQLDHLIMVPGHAIWLGHDPSTAESDDDWILEPMQKNGNSVKTYIKHIKEGVSQLQQDPNSLLVFSGGATRIPPSPPIPEALSYHRLATALQLLPSTPLSSIEGSLKPPLPLNLRAATEEYALDSYENLLFSLARFKEVTGRWPRRVTVVGYGMKRRRFENLHRSAVNFPASNFTYVGIDDTGDTTPHYAGENKYGYTPFLSSPSGCHPPLSIKRLVRNPYKRYHPYHTSCPELSDLLEWCPPLQSVGEEGQQDGYVGLSYNGWVPWRENDDEVMWDRERD